MQFVARSAEGAMFSKLWMLIVNLRCGKNGMDTAFLKVAETIRKRSQKLNWQQNLGFSFSVLVLCFLI